VGWYTRAVQRLGHEQWAISVARRILHSIDMAVLRVTRGRMHATPIPTLVLGTKGRRSGNPHRVPLFYATVEGDPVVGDFNAGRPAPPAWAENLAADPRATVEIRGVPRHTTARLLAGAERDEAMARLLEVWPGYREVMAQAGRPIRVFRLQTDG
jgi:deazaflavin-dependent oxidoreductase (nitroreductase family)